MIDEKNFELLDFASYETKSDAYDMIRVFYSDVKGVTTYYDRENGRWYIVVSKAISKMYS